ncbi:MULTISPECIES: glycosyltransferase family 2 protein [unclassified Campylobacter]|uniref:glycosyltransferase family 2 protein n=1 Tax=unclassified Campylobacter TaxID=2593542 RepID=UPI0022E9ED47|nr:MULTISPECIES: glycosyltransferase family 2 protein [unclassified Campylobacter]MDA3079229.1 glycosyltransferase family 2 protein [Campylobacter sp. CS_NA2]MDA3080468.1 glycosyltransferase family 2 protein [Campylobacter sp. CS_NA1]MDA3085327.1 glycosyltransferase family 2 protein [Campylobacter sp. CS_ED1]MDA3090104.1 glycosyltransferase family 2 protein [Campylobacter sp. CS_ED2]WBR51358.1 glycosyltransferase family 2 protein [Campylobacter sp. CS_NA3]
MKSYAVSIIVPIYNVEKYIAKCATTLFEQDFDSIEYVFVNDCTPDNSMQVLQSVIEKYPNRKNDIKIINNAQNSGSSLTRKNGLDNASGEYILFIDSDDWVELDMVSSLYKKAKDDEADIVCFDNYLNFENKQKYAKHIRINGLENIDNAMQYAKYILAIYVSTAVWNKMAKRDIYRYIEFPNFQYSEDMYITFQLFLKANKISHINKAFIHYSQININSLSTITNSTRVISDYSTLSLKIHNLIDKYNLDYSYKEHFYMGLLTVVIPNTDYNFKKMINKICPNAYKTKYIIKNRKLSLLAKISFLFVFFKLEFITIFIKKIHRKLKTL